MIIRPAENNNISVLSQKIVFEGSNLTLSKIPFQSIWKLIKIIMIIQVFNATMAYFMWVAYGYVIPSWTIAALSVFYTLMILAIKVAQEREAKLTVHQPKSQQLRLQTYIKNGSLQVSRKFCQLLLC